VQRWQLFVATSILAIACASPAMGQTAAPNGTQPPASGGAQSVTLTPAAAGSSSGALPTIEVVATTPLGTGLDVTKVPSQVETISSTDIEEMDQNEITEAMDRRTPGVSVTDEIGSPLVNSLDYRGESASPVPGTTEGLAVYQNGVRINEAYGDVVNWDSFPTIAVDNSEIVSGNPIFGLNALGGAVVLNMKNGFTWQGTEFDARFGSFLRRQASLQYGVAIGNWAYYAAAETIHDEGYRYFGGTHINRGYADIGYRAEGNEVHLSLTAAQTLLGVAGTTPIDLAEMNPAAVFTTPQTTENTTGMIELQDKSSITPNLQFNGDAYVRSFAQAHVDGNISDYYYCGGGTGFCTTGDNTAGNPTPPSQFAAAPSNTGEPDGQPAGEIDRNWTSSKSIGSTLQLTDTDQILGHSNNFTFGVSDDHGWTHFGGNSELATLPADFVSAGYGVFIDNASDDISPVNLLSQNNYLGVYVLDAFDVTDRLTITGGARYNNAEIDIQDQTGQHSGLNGDNNFQRINPIGGATFKLLPNVSVYGSYSEANRAPTPLELGCSSPVTPCQIDNFLVADPPLQQVIARTFEAGIRGYNDITGFVPGKLTWSASAYRTTNSNDIMVEYSQLVGIGYYANAGTTLRQGVDIGATYTTDTWSAYANYSYIQATFQTPIALSSPNNPYSDANGVEYVQPGDNIPGIPRHKVKVGVDYTVFPKWTVGADFIYNSSRYYFGDEINALPQVPGFYSINLRTAYQIDKRVQIYGIIQNVTDNRYYTYGTLYPTSSTVNAFTGGYAGLFASTDPRAVTIAAPISAYIGMKITF
jgi:iron complex outermembrane recepter protein